MFGFLSQKERICKVCNANDDTALIVGVDLSSRGELSGNPPHQYMCKEHARALLSKSVSSFKGKSVCVEPKSGYNAYGYISFERASEWGIGKEETIRAKHLFPTGEKCLCGEQAHFTFCDHKRYYKNIVRLKNTSQLKEIIDPTYYCGEHFVDTLLDYFEAHKTAIDEISPPYGFEGIYLSGEL